MKYAYPIFLTNTKNGFSVRIPDFDANTEGDTIADAMEMARDAIGLLGIDMEDDKKDIPLPSDLRDLRTNAGEMQTFVDVDFAKYRREHDMRTVKKNCTIPSWLCYEAEKHKINFSKVLQSGLKAALNIHD